MTLLLPMIGGGRGESDIGRPEAREGPPKPACDVSSSAMDPLDEPDDTERAGDRGIATALPPDNRILFHRRDADVFGFLSNFHPAAVSIEGEDWETVEHYYQAQKSSDPDYRAAIRGARTPGRAKRIGSTHSDLAHKSGQSWFRRTGREPRPDWDTVKLDIMRRAVRAKFFQHEDLGARLRATDGAALVEDSPTDAYWGTGPDGNGLNWLGVVLTEVRSEVDNRE